MLLQKYILKYVSKVHSTHEIYNIVHTYMFGFYVEVALLSKYSTTYNITICRIVGNSTSRFKIKKEKYYQSVCCRFAR